VRQRRQGWLGQTHALEHLGAVGFTQLGQFSLKLAADGNHPATFFGGRSRTALT